MTEIPSSGTLRPTPDVTLRNCCALQHQDGADSKTLDSICQVANETLDAEKFYSRVEQLFEGKNRSEMAEAIGVSHTAVAKWKKSASKVSAQSLIAIKNASKVSLNWLLTGEGSKYTTAAEDLLTTRQHEQLRELAGNEWRELLTQIISEGITARAGVTAPAPTLPTLFDDYIKALVREEIAKHFSDNQSQQDPT